jgi:RimJ/RimL family protein N-acetyltransferase
MIINTPIFTERLLLRTLNFGDIGNRYLDWMSDPEVLRFLETRFISPIKMKDLVSFINRANVSDNEILVGIFIKDSGLHIGNIKIGPICKNHNRADLGFLVGERSFWGMGYASEAIRAFTKFALSECRLAKITAACYLGNQRSAGALIKAGFIQEGILFNHVSDGQKRDDVLVFGLNNELEVNND